MNRRQNHHDGKKTKSLSPHTLHIQNRIRIQSESKRKQWDLYRHLRDPFLLAEALHFVIENDGAAGIDGVTVSDVKKRSWAFAQELAAELKAKTFKPQAVRRVYIPKNKSELRPLGIPALKDRVVQRALVLLLEPIYELRFKEFSYGFRPNKSAKDCAAEVADTTFHLRHVIDADIESFFDRVQHRKLIGMLKREIADPRILSLIAKFLRAGFIAKDKPWAPSAEGTSQGGPLSPLLGNVYLHYALDCEFSAWKLKDTKLVRYADDFVVMTRTKAAAEVLLKMIAGTLAKVGLNLKAAKTRLVNMQNRYRGRNSHFDFLGFRFHLRAFKDNPKRFWVARQPSEKARRNLTRRLQDALSPSLTWEQARAKAKQIWQGWCEYFRYSNANRVFYRQVRTVKRQLARYLSRKYRRQRRPVPWRKLKAWLRVLTRGIRPIGVINDTIRQRKKSNLEFDL